jgi:TolB protein
VVNADGTGLERLTNVHPRPNLISDLAWSPDGRRMAFSRQINDGDIGIFVINADGTREVALVEGPALQFGPAWSPDSKRIAFAKAPYAKNTGTYQSTDVYVINADGTSLTQITDDPAVDKDPSWSPDGSALAFVSYRDRMVKIYVIAADGTGERRLTDTPGSDYDPAWSPTG